MLKYIDLNHTNFVTVVYQFILLSIMYIALLNDKIPKDLNSFVNLANL